MTGGLLSFSIGTYEHLRRQSLPPMIYAAVGMAAFMIGAFIAWKNEHEKREAAEEECTKLDAQLTDKGPELTILRWQKVDSPNHPNDQLNHGFYIANSGGIAYEVKIESFGVTTSHGFHQRISSIKAPNIPNGAKGFVAVYVETGSPMVRWQLEELLMDSFGAQMDQEHVIPIVLTYDDSNTRHYKALWKLLYRPNRREIAFEFVKREHVSGS